MICIVKKVKITRDVEFWEFCKYIWEVPSIRMSQSKTSHIDKVTFQNNRILWIRYDHQVWFSGCDTGISSGFAWSFSG